MASYNLLPIGNDAPYYIAGVPASGAKLFTYAAGSSTKQTTYTTSLGNVQNANPIILDSRGYPASGGNLVEIWGTAGLTYKFVLAPSTDSDPPVSTIWSRDNISAINDITSAVTEWIAGPVPTFISATQFSLVGDQTATFQVGRRVKTTNTGGTIYSTISVSAFTSLTTVTVVNDSGVLDSGLSAVSYGILSSSNRSTPFQTTQTFLGGDVSLNNTGNYFDAVATASIGASGQTWKITVVATVTDTGGAANIDVRIWDGTTVFCETTVRISSASTQAVVTLVAIVSPSAAATYRLSAKDPTANTGLVQTTASAGTANKATCIIAERLL